MSCLIPVSVFKHWCIYLQISHLVPNSHLRFILAYQLTLRMVIYNSWDKRNGVRKIIGAYKVRQDQGFLLWTPMNLLSDNYRPSDDGLILHAWQNFLFGGVKKIWRFHQRIHNVFCLASGKFHMWIEISFVQKGGKINPHTSFESR